MSNNTKGILFTVFLSLILIFIFFGKIIQSPNDYYFSAKGDGFQAYYGAIYHFNHDSSYLRTRGMNYPYGEMILFTGSQPVIINTLKFVNENVFPTGENTVAVINLLMIFSLLLAALFLVRIFLELEVHWLFASLVSLGICMLSPQLARFGGHFSLSYIFWIPLMFYLVIRFDKNRTLWLSITIGIVTFLAGATHMYFFALFGFITGFYWLGRAIDKHDSFSWLKSGFHFGIQYILPVVILQLIIFFNDNVTDRTSFPYGFFEYRGHPLGVFLPAGKPYAFVPETIKVFEHIAWESLAFVGVASLGGFIAGSTQFFRKIFTGGKIFKVTDRTVLNNFFWLSFAALLFSFGIPFIFRMEWLVDFIGPLKQLRALARFSWLFYYALNIVVFYSLFKKWNEENKRRTWRIIALIAIGFLLFDGFWNIYLNSRPLLNMKPEMDDYGNSSEYFEWINAIDAEDYQAILPIPYFHVGSENIWIESKHEMQEKTMIASLITGLPTTGVHLSRTSLEQTFNNYSLVTEPTETFRIIKDLPNRKSFLLLFNRSYYPSDSERRLIQKSKLIHQNEKIEARELSLDLLESMPQIYQEEMTGKFQHEKWKKKGEIMLNDSSSFFILKDFNNYNSEITFGGEGAFTYPSGKWNVVLEDSLAGVPAGIDYTINFWMHDYRKDAYLRANIELFQKNSKGDETTGYFYSDVHRYIRAFDDNWALIEIKFTTRTENESIKLSLRNSVLTDTEFLLDEVLVKEKGVDICYSSQGTMFFNGLKLKTDSQ